MIDFQNHKSSKNEILNLKKKIFPKITIRIAPDYRFIIKCLRES